MNFLYLILIVCLMATAVSAADCPETPCKHDKVCVQSLGSTSCVRPAKESKACSKSPGRKGVYDSQPPCEDGLKCDTKPTVPVCKVK
ncbi:hypothetical protein NPIL_542401 [Nephila pilipes]|uniref:Uncharacterized protein n=1 Tax=Nephila pilipes TaxID=299642 RepID=A0A8X6QT91_NEPPI|nr:hypothetical protein NPIL_542401 [Nephila pilipes]